MTIPKRANRGRRRAAAIVAGLLAASMLLPATAQAQFVLGVQDDALQQPGASPAAVHAGYAAMSAVDASVVRINVPWRDVAPRGARKPSGFDGSNPADPQYEWSWLDQVVRTVAEHHEQALLVLDRAPQWAEGPRRPNDPQVYGGAWDPNPSAFSAFAHAAASRYSGTFPDPSQPGTPLPRVKLWEVWNEENLPWYLAAPNLVGEYRALLNGGYRAIKAVHDDNVVSVGGLAPVSFLHPRSVSPLKFAASLLCMHRVGTSFHANRSCPQKAHFDVLSHHPYSLAATPTKPAYLYDDVLIADMGKLQRLLQAADRLHTVAPRIHHQLWSTEFAWFTNPPNKKVGDPGPTAARFVAYSMYEMWRSGVRLVIWWTIRDFATADSTPGGGLYDRNGRPKLTLRAFGFPMIASVSHGRGFAWGRAPVSHSVAAVVERASGKRWVRIGTVRTGRDGVFTLTFRANRNGVYRARIPGGTSSLAYDSTPIPPKRIHLVYSG